MGQAKLEKIAEIFKDEEFVKKIVEIKEKEELIKAFAEKGLELSTQEVEALIEKGQEAISSGEFDRVKAALSESELERTAGGVNFNEATLEFTDGFLSPLTSTISAINNIATPGQGTMKDAGVATAAGVIALLTVGPTIYKGTKAVVKGAKKIGNKIYDGAETIGKALTAAQLAAAKSIINAQADHRKN